MRSSQRALCCAVVLVVGAGVLRPLTHAAERFLKDQDTNAHVFPPIIPRDPTGVLPTGHLRPLGYQKPSDGPILGHAGCLTSQEFYEKHVSVHKPVIMRKCQHNSDSAREEWTDDMLKDQFGKLLIPVTKMSPRINVIKLERYLNNYNYENWQLNSLLPHHLRPKLMLPEPLRCGDFPELLQSVRWFVSSGMSARPLLYESDHHLHCVIDGRVDFILIHSGYLDRLHMAARAPNCSCGQSDIDVEMVSVFKYKVVSEMQWKWATARPGDCVYIPARHLYQARSYGHAVAISYVFTPIPKPVREPVTCPLEQNTTLDAITLLWTSHEGRTFVDFDEFSDEIVTAFLLSIIRQEDRLTLGMFQYALYHVLGLSESDLAEGAGSRGTRREKAGAVWDLLQHRDRGYIRRDDITTLKPATLDLLAAAFNKLLRDSKTSRRNISKYKQHPPRHEEL